MTPPQRTVIFDHDGGIDDLLSLLMVLLMPHVRLAGVVVTPADSYLRPATTATQKILRLLNHMETPVSQGMLPGVNPFPADWRAHAYRVDALPILNESTEPLVPPITAPGHEFIAQMLRDAAEPLTMLITGPVTNLAHALTHHPELTVKVAEVVWMGGAIDVLGNVRTYEHDGSAEWNAFWDPIATHQLWQTDVPITLFPLDATDHVPVSLDFLQQLAYQRQYAVSDFAGQCWAMTLGTIPTYEYIYYMWDVLTTGYLGAPQLMTFRELHTEAIATPPSAGRIRPAESGGKLIRAATQVDVSQFHQYLLDLLRQ